MEAIAFMVVCGGVWFLNAHLKRQNRFPSAKLPWILALLAASIPGGWGVMLLITEGNEGMAPLVAVMALVVAYGLAGVGWLAGYGVLWLKQRGETNNG